MEFDEEHGQSVAAALHVAATAAALLPAPTALLSAPTALLPAVVTGSAGAARTTLWTGLPAGAALLPSNRTGWQLRSAAGSLS